MITTIKNTAATVTRLLSSSGRLRLRRRFTVLTMIVLLNWAMALENRRAHGNVIRSCPDQNFRAEIRDHEVRRPTCEVLINNASGRASATIDRDWVLRADVEISMLGVVDHHRLPWHQVERVGSAASQGHGCDREDSFFHDKDDSKLSNQAALMCAKEAWL